MTPQQIKDNKPDGATHYIVMEMIWITPRVYYFKLDNGRLYEWFSTHYAPYETGFRRSELKPL